MRLSRIYTSKMYLTNPRKDKIHAAINSPENVELVQQFADYLDDDSKELLKQAIREQRAEQEAESAKSEPEQPSKDNMSEDNFPDAENNVFSPSFGGGGGGSMFDIPEEGGEEDIGEDTAGEDMFDIPEEGGEDVSAPEDVPLEESKKVSGRSITAGSCVDDIVVDIVSEANVIKGTLNSVQDTAGVIRIAIDDNEMWIYYKDEVNIGDIMVDVIESINKTNHTYLTFSRLARSNNAIVFDILLNASGQIDAIKDNKEDNK